jgi:phosphopantetheine adenylyltransferase
VSSRFVKEIYKMGGELKNIVPEIVDLKLKEKFRNNK